MAPAYNYAAVSISNVVATFCQACLCSQQATLGARAARCASWLAARLGAPGPDAASAAAPPPPLRRLRLLLPVPQYEALKHVSFPLQTLGKCAKMIPVMVWVSRRAGRRAGSEREGGQAGQEAAAGIACTVPHSLVRVAGCARQAGPTQCE